MTITHQTLLDEHGNPVAAQIPWDEFEVIRDLLAAEDSESLTPEWREEIGKRAREIDEGIVDLIEGEDFLSRLRAI